MQMATISRWTLTYFGVALAALVVALALMAAGFGYPHVALFAPETLIVVHLVVVGWLSLLMLGALIQFLPVLVGRELALPRLAPVALGLIVAGLLLLLAGFGALADWPWVSADLAPLGGLVIIAGFAVAAVMLFATLLRASSLALPAGFVAVALMSALVATLLGDNLAAALSGLIGGDFAVALVTHGVALHAGFGLGGWLTLAAMGVSYRLVSMFLISPERKGFVPRLAFVAAVAALAMLCAVLGVLVASNAPWPLGLGLAGLLGLVSLAAYAGDVVILYRGRRRPALELHMAAAVGAFVMLGVGTVAVVVAGSMGSEAGLAAAVQVLALGWLGGLGLAMLYKIVPFLTWLECFAPQMGRMQTPRVQDLVRERRARHWYALYFAMVAVGGLGMAAGWTGVVQVAAGGQLAAVLLIMHQLWRARTLRDLPAQWQDQPGPRLLRSALRPRSLI
ncbi:hypothetical protein [Devosia sediminis]|uniref:Transmembrane protein n=1 Tax=Devosia sediminis TaxID=2798801 RepID=A0A934IVV1_9HYPH|nr:hypothetical protein [Devosia sediminis]MBJ3783155.1 hypothetical protein [Devosia sediminis]